MFELQLHGTGFVVGKQQLPLVPKELPPQHTKLISSESHSLLLMCSCYKVEFRHLLLPGFVESAGTSVNRN